MQYIIDKQTDTDLNISGRFRVNSMFSFFDQTVTKGASNLMEKIFLEPLLDFKKINSRKDVFKSLTDFNQEFPVTAEQFKEVEDYLSSTDHSNILLSSLAMAKIKLMKTLVNDEEYVSILDGITATKAFLKKVVPYFDCIAHAVQGTDFEQRVLQAQAVLAEGNLANFIKSGEGGSTNSAACNRLLRYSCADGLKLVLNVLVEADFYTTVSRVGRENGLVYAQALGNKDMLVNMKNVRHPKVAGAIGNDICLTHEKNLIFLTGANMAGKSTLMKSISIAIHMAHLGFPLAVDSMEFTPLEGMFTSINVSDDITQGYSHFYAEVVRVKNVAEQVAKKKRFLVVFDELFKGTNVKDAYDGTVAITRALSGCRASIFIISTHIMEAGVTLREECKNMQFLYLPTKMTEHGRPRYTYKLEEGIADDRYGMVIIKNEHIIEIIKNEKISGTSTDN